MITGYHGCDARVVDKVLSGEEVLAPSERDFDWLGPGIYFWEHGPQRAYDWAKDEALREPHKIKTPAVLGAFINLGQCFDLLDIANTRLLQLMFPLFHRWTLEAGKSIPQNKHVSGTLEHDRVLRFLDCAVIKYTIDQLAADKQGYHTVRGVFVEGGPAYPGAGVMLKSHIQIAVRDQKCIVGYFRPNPYSYVMS
jgi:hypothetical protein